MNDYSQPDFYHFSEDSLILSKYVLDQVNSNGIRSILDIGCGSGVIGIEIAKSLKGSLKLVGLEPQKAFNEHINLNVSFLPSNCEYEIVNQSIGEFNSSEKFDLIVSNPPYFERGKGRVSSSLERQVCRTFEIDDLSILLHKTKTLLSEKGVAFIIFPTSENGQTKLFDEFGFFLTLKVGRVGIFQLA